MTTVAVDDSGVVRLITMSSENGLNALDTCAREMLRDALNGAESERHVRAVILLGATRAFSVGADISEFPDAPCDPSQFLLDALAIFSLPERLSKPVVCVIEGLAIAGGLELALASDWIFAEPQAELALTEARFGLLPGYALSRLARSIGSHRARRLMMTGETLKRDAAAQLGLPVSPSEEGSGLDDALEFCTLIARSAPSSVAEIKRLDSQLDSDRDFELTVNTYSRLWNEQDGVEGLRAFREHRSPAFATNSE
jgi:enoyl-CoA hydratase/carnithine racemase